MKNRKSKIISDQELITWTVDKFYSKGKGKECELCRMRGWRKKRAYKEMKIDGIGYFVCYDCHTNEVIKQERKKCAIAKKKKL